MYLIPDEVHKEVTDNNRWCINERLNSFMTGLEQSIKLDPSVLEKFVAILRESDAAFYAVLIRTISEPTLPEVLTTVIWFYFVLYLISYAAVSTKIKRTNIFQQRNFHTCFVYDMGSVRN